MSRPFNDSLYPERQHAKNKFPVLKRKFNGDLKSGKIPHSDQRNRQQHDCL